MITIIENSAGEMTPSSRPMLRTINSISPRVFISVPSAAAVAPGHARQPRRDERAAELPGDGDQHDQSAQQPGFGAADRSIRVRMPVNAKNAGRSRIVTRCLRLPDHRLRPAGCRDGMIAPSRNAPKIAWMPIASVASADSSSATNSIAVVVGVSPAAPCVQDAAAPARGLTTSEHERDVDRPPDRDATARLPTSARATPTTNASRHQAVTSSMAAQLSAMTPISVLRHARDRSGCAPAPGTR